MARATVRAVDTVADLPRNWLAEPLDDMLPRVTRELWALTHESTPLTDIEMSFVLPFVTSVLTTELDLKVKCGTHKGPSSPPFLCLSTLTPRVAL